MSNRNKFPLSPLDRLVNKHRIVLLYIAATESWQASTDTPRASVRGSTKLLAVQKLIERLAALKREGES
jgi:hypothetical protein